MDPESILEGKIAVAKYEKLRVKLKRVINEQEDSLLFHRFK